VRYSRARFLRSTLAATAFGVPADARAQSPPLRVGSTPNDSYAEPFYAQDEGFFTRTGLNVEVHPFATGAAVTTALAGNAIDVGITNPISLANAVEHGFDFAFFAVAAIYNRNESALCVAADSPIKSAKDLEGKTVGTTAIRDSNSLYVVAWIDQAGGDSSKVQLVELPFSAMAPAIRRGTVAAAPIAEPSLSVAKNEGGIRILAHPEDVLGKNFMVGGWFARVDFIEAHRPLLHRFVATIYETARWANSHPDESSAILAKYSKMDPEVVRNMSRAPYGTSFGPQMLQPYLDYGYKYKYIGRHFKATDLIVAV
jgi:NitT/TauT family transport system substrate-binding protein